MHASIVHKRADIARVCLLHGVQKLDVFGSGARGIDFDSATSDVDFLVEYLPGSKHDLDTYFALKADLKQILGRDVDLVEAKAVVNPYLLAGINSAREVLYLSSRTPTLSSRT
ncbi:MAG: nucleotidyltransferase domain-containing protein [Massilia sp.]|nr:nucleotidyltransferase domain-containing protein [Massilia sp.]